MKVEHRPSAALMEAMEEAASRYRVQWAEYVYAISRHFMRKFM